MNFSNTGGSGTYTIFYAHGRLGSAIGSGASGTSTPSASTSYTLFYNTSENKIYFDAGTWEDEVALPLCIASGTNGTLTSIDQVFNGFGYIGSTVFALPGVEGLIPNGRNPDGTCRNKKLKINSIKIIDVGASRVTSQDKLFIYEEGSFSAWYHNGLYYNNFPSPSNGNWFRVYSKDDNLWYESDDGGAYYPVYVVKVNEEVITENYKITSIKPFSVVTKLIDQETPHIVETYHNGTSWYRVYSDGWCEQGGLLVINASNRSGATYDAANLSLLKPVIITTWNCQARHDRFNSGLNYEYSNSIISSVGIYQVNDSGSTFANPFVIWYIGGYTS